MRIIMKFKKMIESNAIFAGEANLAILILIQTPLGVYKPKIIGGRCLFFYFDKMVKENFKISSNLM